MSIEEFKFSDKKILIEKREKLDSSYKIKSYVVKLKYMEDKEIPQKNINETLNHLFFKDRIISNNTKNSISKMIYSENDRIIILITQNGKDIIRNRDKLVRNYGWFFFIAETEKKQKKTKKEKLKKKDEKKQEKTISTEEFQYEDSRIPLKQKENMRPLYYTKEYRHYLKIIRSENIQQLPIKAVLNDLFFVNELIPIEEKKGIRKIIYYQEDKVIVIKSLLGDEMYENLENLVKKYGWYFYITGVPVGESDISIAIDKIEKKFNSEYFSDISLVDEENNSSDIRVTIYPIILKPNHNCHILGLGGLNILLDCGLSEKDEENEVEGDFRYIEEYLQNLPQYILETEKERKEITTNIPFKNVPKNPKIDAIFISHSHYDHVSGLKELNRLFPEVPILCSRITLDLYLLRDSNFLKQESHAEIEEQEYQNIVKNVIYVENGTKIEFKDKNCYLSFFHAGHMPGALML
ncbi:MAG: MBL fold metallo-hydrolase, partial [Promethearchaeota archaeon]